MADGALSLGPLASTRGACPRQRMPREARGYLVLLDVADEPLVRLLRQD